MEKEFPDVKRGTKRKAEEVMESYREKYLLACKWKGCVLDKLNKASPFNFFLTRVEELSKTHDEDLTIMFPELLDESLGNVIDSLHINYCVDLSWLLAQYAVNSLINPSLTILYDVDSGRNLDRTFRHLKLTAVHVQSPYAFGHHHTYFSVYEAVMRNPQAMVVYREIAGKMSIFYYEDKSIRFVIGTANLIESDWEDRTQGVWISPKCPYLGDGVPINYGESETLFKVDVIRYLNSYRLAQLRKWLHRIQQSDCSSIRVCFVGSIPGNHGDEYGHLKLGKLIKKHSLKSDTSGWTLIAQCSSIGSLGPSAQSWLTGEFSRSLSADAKLSTTKVSVIYPSVTNVRRSIHKLFGGDCLPYSSRTHVKQKWLNGHLMQWKSDCRHRSRAVPHIKTYTKMSPTANEFPWFVLTSANLSKAAWGKMNKAGLAQIMSYEVGVVFFPKFLIGKNVFTIKKGGDSTGNEEEEFPVPYDLPLTSYRPTDQIFLYDKHYPSYSSEGSSTVESITLN